MENTQSKGEQLYTVCKAQQYEKSSDDEHLKEETVCLN